VILDPAAIFTGGFIPLHETVAGLRLHMRYSVLLFVLCCLLPGCATLNQSDRDLLRKHRVSAELYARMLHRESLSLADVLELSEKRVPVPFVVRYLRSTVAVYRLSSDDVVQLRRAGVNAQIIDYMLATPSLYAPMHDPFWYAPDPFWWGYSPIIVRHGHHHHHHHRHR
jgi:hypothetical protein